MLVLQHQKHTQQHDSQGHHDAVEPYGPGAPQARASAQSIGRLDHAAFKRHVARDANGGYATGWRGRTVFAWMVVGP
jgi:hypothetical protein